MDSRFGFDTQAEQFDDRTGLPESVQVAVACAVAARCGPTGTLLEIGAGTGQIGQHLAQQLGPRYLGLDASRPMLARFRARSPHAALVLGDARAAWPVARERFDAVFMSRVLHLFDPAHVARQLRHTLRSGGCLLVGRRERDGGSVQALLRHELQRSLRALGYAPRGPRRAGQASTTASEQLVAEWTTRLSAAQLIESWRAKPGLCGNDVGEADKRELLLRLERHARTRLGSLAREHEHHERYVLRLEPVPR